MAATRAARPLRLRANASSTPVRKAFPCAGACTRTVTIGPILPLEACGIFSSPCEARVRKHEPQGQDQARVERDATHRCGTGHGRINAVALEGIPSKAFYQELTLTTRSRRLPPPLTRFVMGARAELG